MSRETEPDLAAAFEGLSHLCGQVESLCETLNALLVQSIPSAGLGLSISPKPKTSDQSDDSRWLFTATANSFELTGRRGPPMYLGYQASLAGDGARLLGKPVPMLHVCYWDCPIDFDDAYMQLPVGQGYGATLRKKRLIVWPGEKVAGSRAPRPEQWTFTLKLLQLRSSQDLETLVVQPALALLALRDVDKALPGSAAYVNYPPQAIPQDD